MRTNWIGFTFEDKGVEWEVVEADDAFGEQDSYWWCIQTAKPSDRVSYGNRSLYIKHLEQEVAYEQEQRAEFCKEIWAIVRPDDADYDYPAQIIRHTQNALDEVRAEAKTLRSALIEIRNLTTSYNRRNGTNRLTSDIDQCLAALDQKWPEQYYVERKIKVSR